jgi:putative nucleotidyltransferase with HDIG domain/PAS domain S-box-containing protein
MFGYERDEIIGKMKLTDLLTDDGIKIFQETFTQLKSKGSSENIEYDIKRKDGTFLPVVLNATGIYDKDGNFLRTRSLLRNNGERKTYEKMLLHSAQEWRSTFDSMPYGVMLLDNEFNIIRSNLYVSRLIGIPIEDMVMKKCYELMHGTDKPIEQCLLKTASDFLKPKPFEFYEPRFSKYFMAYSTPIYTDGDSVQSYVHALVDITEIKNKEKELIISRNAFFNMLKDVDFSYAELKGLYDGLIHSFANAIDAKSKWTKGHSERVTHYAVAIAKEMGLLEKDIETLRIAALLHDVGKIGTYDVILDKPGRLNDEEWNLIRMHPVKGEEILRPIKQLQDILPIIRHHHERIDGKGYPDGLKGEEIPLLPRVIAVADSFDSMTSDRPYRPAPSREYAMSELKKYSGIQFDPQAVEAFLRIL